MASPQRLPKPVARLALIGLGICLVALLELAIRVLVPSAAAGGPSLFVKGRDQAGRRAWVLNPARQHWFPEQSFAVRRPEDGVLVFCVGGSDVYGYPHGAAYAFPARLQRLLTAAHPERTFEVVNVGGMSYGSERMVGLVRELVGYRPDAIIVTTGNNELVEADWLDRSGDGSGSVGRARSLANHLALYRLGASLLAPAPAATEAEVGSPFGIDVERRENRILQKADRQATATRFRRNLELMAEAARDADVTLVLTTVGRNLADWQPGGGMLAPALDDLTVLRFAASLADALALEAEGQPDQALAALDDARAIDPAYAPLCFRRGRLLRALSRAAEAREELLTALRHDATPIRALPELNQQARELARVEGLPMVDLEQSFERASGDGIPDRRLFLDYCHPNAAGHELIAAALGPALEAAAGLPPRLPGGPTATPPAAEEPAAEGFALWWFGNVALRQGRPETAERLLRQAVEAKPDEYRTLVALAQVVGARGAADEALALLERAVELAPQSLLARNALGVHLTQIGRLDEAEQVLEQALHLGRSPDALHASLGTVFLRRRDADGATRHLLEAIRLGPGSPGVHRNLGLARLLAGDQEGATRAFLDELRRNPLDGPSALHLARLLASSGTPELRAESARLAQALQPRPPE